MSRLIKGSSIKLSEKSPHPPTAPSMLLRGGARVEEGSSPLLTLARMHPPRTPPRLTPQVPVGAPPLKDGHMHAPQTPKWDWSALIPLSPSSHPPLLPSVSSAAGVAEGGMVCLGGWLVGWGGGAAIPCSIPTNFLISFGSNALSQIHAPNLSSVQPLPPPSSFFCHFGSSCNWQRYTSS